ncbi:hypothetical protein BCR44DRAFT_90892 [Catenaria anguillulae PL171]|uniref:F-box domain-containing protein n=1 Tax=Catenaria anguillulae PL171 TaxID=765915 RepID=A0A1Y2HF38_9FUNG|nr:hypothetical protein BCR44DRAFT_90892 [Catenaria anguillulae PL171]
MPIWNRTNAMLQTLCAFLLQVLVSALVTVLAAPGVDLVFHYFTQSPSPQPPNVNASQADDGKANDQPMQRPPSITAQVLRSPVRSNAHTDTSDSLLLLNLPVELIEAILFHLQPAHPGAILQFALTCTSALHISVPILYSSIRVSNLLLLPQLASTPSIASCVHSITASPKSTSHPGFGRIKQSIDRYRPHEELGIQPDTLPPDSQLDSYLHALTQLTMLANKLEKQCSPHDLESLPFPLLKRMALACPNVTSIDLSAMPMSATPHFITYGIRDLALILCKRKGCLHCPWFPFSSISLTRTSAAEAEADTEDESSVPLPDVYGIVGIDWGMRKRLSVVCIKSAPWLKQLRYPVDYCLIPVQELVPEDELLSGKWIVIDLPTTDGPNGLEHAG